LGTALETVTSVVAGSPLKQQAKQNISENKEAYCFPEAFRRVI
jgi:hypothetical protein